MPELGATRTLVKLEIVKDSIQIRSIKANFQDDLPRYDWTHSYLGRCKL